ncbi:MAG: hypothetical protein K2J63_13145 [Muribaculaceae bacterium]|nr:hypothetical protein [Muribaculaceae bacterium]
MTVVIVLVIFAIVWLLFGQQIKRWLAGFMARRTEDYIRKATGMPPRPGSREAKRQQREEQKAQNQRSSQGASSYYDGRSSRRRRRSTYSYSNEPLIPKEYAEDVEFTETISYSETTIGATASDGRNTTVYHESQVSDVEWEEIKVTKKR